MLTLRRKLHQEVVLTVHEPCKIVVAPMEIRREESVVVGFIAPDCVDIQRREVHDAMERDRERGL